MSFVAGLLCCAVLLGAFVSGGGNPALLFDWHSILLVAGGTMALGFMSFPGGAFWGRLGDAAHAMHKENEKALEEELLSLARLAREKGVLALEEAESRVSDALVKEGLLLISGAASQETVRSVLQTQADGYRKQEQAAHDLLERMGYLAIGLGIVGTLIQAIFMLRRYTGPQMFASGLAGVLLPVAYGVLLAYMVLFPLAARVRAGSARQESLRKAAVEGVLAVQAGESLFVVQERLQTILHPSAKKRKRAAQ